LEGSDNAEGLKLNGTHQILIYCLVVASKEIGLEVNADKTKYMVAASVV